MNKNKFVIPIGITIITLVAFSSTHFSGYSFGGDKVISSNASIEKTRSLPETNDKEKIIDESHYKLAPEFADSGGNLNINGNSSGQQQHITMASLKGKVVLVNFWTYSCINVLRTLPHLME